MAEGARFELAVPCDTLALQASALDHYATLPHNLKRYSMSFNILYSANYSTRRVDFL